TPPCCDSSRRVLAPKCPPWAHGGVPRLAISRVLLTSENPISQFPLCRPRSQQFRRSFRSVPPVWPAQRHIKFRTRRALRRRKLERRFDQVVHVRQPLFASEVANLWGE